MQLEQCGLHDRDRQSHVTPPCRSFLGSFEYDDVPESLMYSSDEDEAEAEVKDEDDADDASGDDYDSGDDNDNAQQSVADGMYPKLFGCLFAC